MLHLLDHIEVSPTCKKPLTCLDELTAAKLIIRGAVDWCRVVVISFRVTFRFIVVFYIWVSQNENTIICSEQRYFDLKGTRNPEFCVPKSSDWTQWSKKNPYISFNGTKWVTRSSPPARYGRHRLPSSTCKQNRGLKRLAIQLHSKCEDSPCNHGGMMLVSPLSVHQENFSRSLLGDFVGVSYPRFFAKNKESEHHRCHSSVLVSRKKSRIIRLS